LLDIPALAAPAVLHPLNYLCQYLWSRVTAQIIQLHEWRLHRSVLKKVQRLNSQVFPSSASYQATPAWIDIDVIVASGFVQIHYSLIPVSLYRFIIPVWRRPPH